MTIPKFNELFPYVLEELINGEELHIKEIKKRIKEKLELSEEEMNLLVPSGKVTYINDRIGWACSYLKMAGLLETPKRGIYVLSKLGNEYFNKYGFNIELSQVKNLIDKNKPEVIEIKSEPSTIEEETPEDQIHNAIINFNAQLADDILTEISNMSPRFFEKLVLDLLYAIGYGAKSENAIIKTPYTNDDGIDGMIKEDELGLDYIYIQAKRWATTVGQPEIQKFAGALSGVGARKGVFITTSDFSRKAIDYAKTYISSKIILIDGKRLTDLMISFGVGLTVEKEYKIQKIDKDYYDEEM